jgi:DNA-binding beta-propeller fold protein YncE
VAALWALLLCSAAVPAAWADSVYVTNNFGGSVSQYDIGPGGALAAKTPATVAAGTNPIGIAVNPDGRSVYVTNATAMTISQYDIGAAGALVPKTPATVAQGVQPFGIAVSPDGKSAYVANANAGTISQYDVGGDGTLTAKTPATVAGGANPGGIAVTPDGKSVYAANGGGGTVSQFDVGPGGALTAKTPATVPAGSSPFAVAVSRDGKNVYVTNQGAGSHSVSQYDIGAGGALSPKAPATVPAGFTPRGVAISADDKNVFVPNINGGNVSQYDVGAGGALAAKTPATAAAGSGPDGVATTPPPPPSPRPPSPPSAGSVIGQDFPCVRRAISLVSAAVRGSFVVLSGLVQPQFAGRPVTIFANTRPARAGALTRLATVRSNAAGEFTARLRGPRRKDVIKTRYRAQVDRFRSIPLKLPQSLSSSSVRAQGQQIELRGKVKRSLLGRRNPVVIKRLICGRYRSVARAKPDRKGNYVARFSVPPGLTSALFRAETFVLNKSGSRRYVKQYGRAISITLTNQTG